jgi:subtilisin family serine protease
MFVAMFCVLLFNAMSGFTQTVPTQGEFWRARDVVIDQSSGAKPVRIGIWDSGVDLRLFDGHLATDKSGNVYLRGYDPFKRRKDTAMAVLPPSVMARMNELNVAFKAFDDMDSGVENDATKALNKRLKDMSADEKRSFNEATDLWSGYSHGTAVADIAIAGNSRAEIVVARMEWWHGSPPVPCWTKELADREADSIRDLIRFLVKSGSRVVNMSWGRFERSYINNLKECAPKMKSEDRLKLARYTVDGIRKVLMKEMAAAPRVLFVGAAGNDGGTVADANPATRFSLPNFILVGAVDQTGKKASFTNTGPEVTLYANGERVPARMPGGDVSYPSGTSMATPNVTNAAAKMLAVNPQLTGAEMRRLLEQTADANATGQKLLHPANAVAAAKVAIRR